MSLLWGLGEISFLPLGRVSIFASVPQMCEQNKLAQGTNKPA